MIRILLLVLAVGCSASAAEIAPELVYVDNSGVIRWRADEREVALFGANYCLPSSGDYRAAGYVGADRKKLVEKDLTHFARMGWDGLRLALWGDWENCDREGNLIVNEHLDLMDYVIFQAKRRGVFMLFTPMHRHSALWPDGKDSDAVKGFSKFYPPSELGTNPRAIAAQQNYLRQVLAHVNPYTGVALKDEPAILFIELINEPHHHPDDVAGSVAYINALVEAVRSTGCAKVLFHNLSQDFPMAPVIAASQAQGFSIGWYPTALVAGHTLVGNHLRSADHYTPLLQLQIPPLPRIVYEFDSADMVSGYMYPAMVRSFREAGAQFAAMFAYDMLDTAPYNLGWQTHYLNLVYSPRKAVSAIIAAEAMRTLPRGVGYGRYPENRRFGPFRVSYEEDSSELVTAEKFLYANDTATQPPDAAALRQVIGAGSSPVVAYEGCGSYFLDRLGPGQWRLEVYPDAILVQDPFAQRLNYQTVSSRLVWHKWSMTVRLPDLGDAFAVMPLNAGNQYKTKASSGRFTISPGVYLLAHGPRPDRNRLPPMVGHIGLDEFVCPPAPELPAQLLPDVPEESAADQPVSLAVDVVDAWLPRSVTLRFRPAGESAFHSVALPRQRGYRYETTLSSGSLPGATFEYCFVVKTAEGKTIRHPAGTDATLTARRIAPAAPVILFDAARDGPRLAFTRTGDPARHAAFQNVPATGADAAALRLVIPPDLGRDTDDYTASLVVKERIADRRVHLSRAKAIEVRARSSSPPGQVIVLALLEADGTAWSKELALGPGWQDLRIPLDELQIAQGVLMPSGYPGHWNYWSPPAQGRGAPGDQPRLAEVEQVQISYRPAPADARPAGPGSVAWAEIAAVKLTLE